MAAKSSVRGFAMAEMILATGVVLAGSVLWVNQAAKNIRAVDARNIGEYMAAFQSAAVSYATENNAVILAASADGTGAATTCVVNYVNPTTSETMVDPVKHTCAVDVSWLVFKGYLPPSFKTTNKLGQAPVGIYHLVYNGAVPTTNLELLVVAASSVGAVTYAGSKAFNATQDAFAAANLLGTNMGVVPADKNLAGCTWDPADATKRYACGTQGAWNVKLSDFVN